MMSNYKIRKHLASPKASLKVEGLNVSRQSLFYGAKFLKGELSSEEIIKTLTKQFANKKGL